MREKSKQINEVKEMVEDNFNYLGVNLAKKPEEVDKMPIPEGFEEVEGNSDLWLPEIGETIQGVIIDKIEGSFGLQVLIEGINKERWLTPSHKVLIERISKCEIGDVVIISLRKEELPTVKGQNPTKIYKVLRKLN